jgi:hypothetical protein
MNIDQVKDKIFSISRNYEGITGNCTLNNMGDRINGFYNIYKLYKENSTYKIPYFIYDQGNDSFQRKNK